MADEPRTGAFSYVKYGKEATFGSEAGTIESVFGHDVTINAEPRNSLIQTRGLGDRNVQKIIAGQFEGQVTIEGTLANTHWIAAGWGASSTSVASPDTHTFSESDTLPSITIENGVDLGTTDSVVKYLGCKLNELELSGSNGEVVRFRATFFYKTESEGSTLDATPPSESEEPFNFANVSVDLPDGTTLSRVQRFSLRLTNNLIRVYGLGSRETSKIIPGGRDYEFTIEKTFENADLLEEFYGSGTGPASTISETDYELNITNGQAGDDERHLAILLTGVKLDPHTKPQSPNELIVETVTGLARTGTATAQDNDSSTIFD